MIQSITLYFRIVLVINYDTTYMSHTNNKEVKEGVEAIIEYVIKSRDDLGVYNYLIRETLTQLPHQELQKAVQEEKLKHCCCLIEDSKITERCKLHGDELQKAREEEREETREILRCISRMVEINATNLENYILGQMPIVQSELDQPNS